MISTELSATGRFSIPLVGILRSYNALRAFSLDFSSIFGSHVHAKTLPLAPTFSEARKQSNPAAGTQIQHHPSLFQRCQRDRITAAQPHVCAFGHGVFSASV